MIEDIIAGCGIYDDIRNGIDSVMSESVSGLTDVAKVSIVNLLRGKGCRLLVTYDEKRGRHLAELLEEHGVCACFYPAKDIIFFNASIHGDAIVKERMKAVEMLFNGDDGVIVAPAAALLDKLPDIENIKKRIIHIKKSDVIDRDKLTKRLVDCGYSRETEVERPGDFALRGNIIDIYPFTYDQPVRIELWDEDIDSMRVFDIASQRAVSNIDEVSIYPASEYSGVDMSELADRLEEDMKEAYEVFYAKKLLTEAMRLKKCISELIDDIRLGTKGIPLESFVSYFCKEPKSLLDFFDEKGLVFIDEASKACESLSATYSEYCISMRDRLTLGYVLAGQTNAIYSYDEMIAKLSGKHRVQLSMLESNSDLKTEKSFILDTKTPSDYGGDIDVLAEDLKWYISNGYEVRIAVPNKAKQSKLIEDLGERDVYAVSFAVSGISAGCIFPGLKKAVITYAQITGRFSRASRVRRKADSAAPGITDFGELTSGDYVVHVNYGIGIYRGLEQIEVDGGYKDYLKIEYKNNGKLYVPATSLHMISKYSASSDVPPKVNALGDAAWKKAKQKVKAACEETAKYLVELYASRHQQTGFRYSEDTVWQKEFEDLFPYDETADQLRAINDIKKDMESGRIMDRLVCGDVGFGKTEVAIRAAFKAVNDSKQVAYLVPTTILATQHFNTFESRMKLFGINVALMSRLVPAGKQRAIIEGLKEGRVDVVIGTHRLLSKDIGFRDLGLLIIDEEQRFGVTHKEKIKQLKSDVDVITLSATPIPRTLHMSLSGIRDMSVLTQAPVDRLPIQTFVIEYDEQMIKEAIGRELARNGQVYYVYNRINNIDDIARKVSSLFPDAKVCFAHGQMPAKELDAIMADFIGGEIDILVSTTIIETGLDIPNVNTIIIHDAQNYGLAQLYQLRGRVGRSSRTAYAFLTYTKDRIIGEQAQKRLHAIREFTDLGSGFRIAMKDLEIRGAGSVLGENQSGHMTLVGYDLYVKLLNRAIMKENGVEEVKDFDTSIDVDVDAYIPDDYITNSISKLDIYKRIADIATVEDYQDMIDELTDRFGDVPNCALTLLRIALLKSRAHNCFITDIKGDKDRIRFLVYEEHEYDSDKLKELIVRYKGCLSFIGGETKSLVYRPRLKGELDKKDAFMDKVEELIGELEKLKA